MPFRLSRPLKLLFLLTGVILATLLFQNFVSPESELESRLQVDAVASPLTKWQKVRENINGVGFDFDIRADLISRGGIITGVGVQIRSALDARFRVVVDERTSNAKIFSRADAFSQGYASLKNVKSFDGIIPLDSILSKNVLNNLDLVDLNLYTPFRKLPELSLVIYAQSDLSGTELVKEIQLNTAGLTAVALKHIRWSAGVETPVVLTQARQVNLSGLNGMQRVYSLGKHSVDVYAGPSSYASGPQPWNGEFSCGSFDHKTLVSLLPALEPSKLWQNKGYFWLEASKGSPIVDFKGKIFSLTPDKQTFFSDYRNYKDYFRLGVRRVEDSRIVKKTSFQGAGICQIFLTTNDGKLFSATMKSNSRNNGKPELKLVAEDVNPFTLTDIIHSVYNSDLGFTYTAAFIDSSGTLYFVDPDGEAHRQYFAGTEMENIRVKIYDSTADQQALSTVCGVSRNYSYYCAGIRSLSFDSRIESSSTLRSVQISNIRPIYFQAPTLMGENFCDPEYNCSGAVFEFIKTDSTGSSERFYVNGKIVSVAQSKNNYIVGLVKRSSGAPTSSTPIEANSFKLVNGEILPKVYSQNPVYSDVIFNCSFNSTTVSHGSSVKAFRSSKVQLGSSCVSEERKCTNGVLSGSFMAATCTEVGAAKNCSFNSSVVSHGASVRAFVTAKVPFGSSCVSEERKCTNGALSGSFSNGSCEVEKPKNCTINGKTIDHGASTSFFAATSVPFGQTCRSESRQCNNGTLNGSFSAATCEVEKPKACNFNGSAIPHGGGTQAFASATVFFSETCQAETRQCNNGQLSGSYTASKCEKLPARSCTFDGKVVQHSFSAAAYDLKQGPTGKTCQLELRRCNDGTLSGSHPYGNCNQIKLDCEFNGQIVPDNTSVIAFESATGRMGRCYQQERRCSRGKLSGFYTASKCEVEKPKDCSFNGFPVKHQFSVTAYASATVPRGQNCRQENRVCQNGVLSGSFSFSSCIPSR